MSTVWERRLVRLETVTIATPFGVRFWDSAYEGPAGDGLLVRAWPEDRPHERPTDATPTRAGVYALHHLPGLHAAEYPDGASPGSPPLSRRFVVAVRDPQGIFLPTVFRVDLPHLGVYPHASGGSPGFYLFSAPTRPPAQLAVVRAELVERASRRPAAYAVLEVSQAARTWYGITNADGRCAVMFGYPPFGPTPPASPPRSAESAHERQRWPITLRVRYQPAAQLVPPGADQPDLASIFAQAPANLRPTEAGPAAPALSSELEFGAELFVASTPLDTLLIG